MNLRRHHKFPSGSLAKDDHWLGWQYDLQLYRRTNPVVFQRHTLVSRSHEIQRTEIRKGGLWKGQVTYLSSEVGPFSHSEHTNADLCPQDQPLHCVFSIFIFIFGDRRPTRQHQSTWGSWPHDKFFCQVERRFHSRKLNHWVYLHHHLVL